MNLELKDKRVMITASVQGIGFATAESFLQEGSTVIINGRNKEHLNAAQNKLKEKYGKKVFSFQGDMQLKKDIERLCTYINDTFNGLDILISNLGNGKPLTTNQLDGNEWNRFYNVNVMSSVELLNSVYPLLKKGDDPAIVLLSSIISKEVSAAPIGYAAAKSAISTLSKYLSKLWASDGIRVNCVLPGNVFFEGGRWEELKSQDEKSIIQYIQSSVAMKRFGTPSEIADAIVFLASPRSSFTTGAELSVDGGQSNAL